MARLKDRYREEVAPALKDRFEIQNPMRIPGLEKIVVNMGVGEAVRTAGRSTARWRICPGSPARRRR
jgi:large subunit ribosomal protein L5